MIEFIFICLLAALGVISIVLFELRKNYRGLRNHMNEHFQMLYSNGGDYFKWIQNLEKKADAVPGQLSHLQKRIEALEPKVPKKTSIIYDPILYEEDWYKIFKKKISHYSKDTRYMTLQRWQMYRYKENKIASAALLRLMNEYGRKSVESANGGGTGK